MVLKDNQICVIDPNISDMICIVESYFPQKSIEILEYIYSVRPSSSLLRLRPYSSLLIFRSRFSLDRKLNKSLTVMGILICNMYNVHFKDLIIIERHIPNTTILVYSHIISYTTIHHYVLT